MLCSESATGATPFDDNGFNYLRSNDRSPQKYLNLALFPLLHECDKTPDYLLLDEALEQGLARITEVSDDGRVPELAFENASSERILLVDGDELVGAKQNRILNLTILVGIGQKLVIPVSCVEQGRWAWRSSELRSARRSLFARARAKKMRQVTESLSATGARRSDQSQVWRDVAEKAAFCKVESGTGAMSDVYEATGKRLDHYVHAFKAEPRQRGAVVAIDGKAVGLELFDSTVAFGRYLEKLVRSFALDAIETADGEAAVPSAAEARRFLDVVQAAVAERYAALGEGEDIRITGDGLAGGALAADGRIVHLAGLAVA